MMKNICTLRRFYCQIINDKNLLDKLERLSALKMTEIDRNNLEEDIKLAQKIFDIDTKDVKPLFNVAEDFMNCPLRGDEIERTPKEKVLSNAKLTYEGFFVAPTVAVTQKQKPSKDGNSKDDIF